MAQTNYTVTLAVDGNHSVSVASDDPAAVKAELGWAKEIFDQLKARSKPKGEEAQKEEEAPICAVHNLPMVSVKGKYGFFWSCHQRNQSGSFCDYRPEEQ